MPSKNAASPQSLTADIDFQNLVLEHGQPPKVIRIEKLDYPTEQLAELICREALRIKGFLNGPAPLLVLRR